MKKLFSLVLVLVVMLPIMAKAYDYTEYYDKISPERVIHIKAGKPRTYHELSAFTQYATNEMLNDPDVYVEYSDATGNYVAFEDTPVSNEDGSFDVYVNLSDLAGRNCEPDPSGVGSRCNTIPAEAFKVYFDDTTDKDTRDKINEIAGRMSNKKYILDDLGFVSYLYTIDSKNTLTSNVLQTYLPKGIMYSNDVIEHIGNNNIEFFIEENGGDGDDYILRSLGRMVLKYNGILYSSSNETELDLKYLMYVPSDTEDTPEAYVNVVKSRIKKYLGIEVEMEPYKKISDILIHDGDTIPDYTYEEYYANKQDMLFEDTFENHYGGYSNKLDMIYRFKFNEVWYYFMIEKNDTRLKEPLFSVKDIGTNISIDADDGTIPLDTTVSIDQLDNSSDEYNNIDNAITGEFDAYDFKLFSCVLNSYITKINNGKFRVSLPVPKKLEGKNITVYYMNVFGKLEEHPVTIKDGFATFETNHFSTYILSEKQLEDVLELTVNNPSTGDNIHQSIMLLLVGLCGAYYFTRSLKEC